MLMVDEAQDASYCNRNLRELRNVDVMLNTSEAQQYEAHSSLPISM